MHLLDVLISRVRFAGTLSAITARVSSKPDYDKTFQKTPAGSRVTTGVRSVDLHYCMYMNPARPCVTLRRGLLSPQTRSPELEDHHLSSLRDFILGATHTQNAGAGYEHSPGGRVDEDCTAQPL